MFVSFSVILSSVERSSEWVSVYMDSFKRHVYANAKRHSKWRYILLYKRRIREKENVEKRNKALGHVYLKKKKKLVDTQRVCLQEKQKWMVFFRSFAPCLDVFSCFDKIIMSNRHVHGCREISHLDGIIDGIRVWGGLYHMCTLYKPASAIPFTSKLTYSFTWK